MVAEESLQLAARAAKSKEPAWPTLQPSHVIAPKWNPDDGASHILQGMLGKSTFNSLSSSRP